MFAVNSMGMAGMGMNSWNDMGDSFPSRSGQNLIALVFFAVCFYHAPMGTSIFMAVISGAAIFYNGGNTFSFLMLAASGAVVIYLKFFVKPSSDAQADHDTIK
ncbi:MAG: hypothetical protein JZU65_07215 [Chlorobium sp.]|nr:hypothetical protein [Chlorobium sp.]